MIMAIIKKEIQKAGKKKMEEEVGKEKINKYKKRKIKFIINECESVKDFCF